MENQKPQENNPERPPALAGAPCSAALVRIEKLCDAWMDLDPTLHDDEDLAELAGKVIGEIAEIATVELVSMANKRQNDQAQPPHGQTIKTHE